MKKLYLSIAMALAVAGLQACKSEGPTGPIIPPPDTPTATIGSPIGWSTPFTLNVPGTYNVHHGCGTTPANFQGGPASLMQVTGPGSYVLTEAPPGATGMCGSARSVMVVTTGRAYREEIFPVPGAFPGSL